MATAPTSNHSAVNVERGSGEVVYPPSSLLFRKNGGPPRNPAAAIFGNPPANQIPEGAVAVPVAEAHKGIVGKLPPAIQKRITPRILAARNLAPVAGRGGRRKNRKSRKTRKNRKNRK